MLRIISFTNIFLADPTYILLFSISFSNERRQEVISKFYQYFFFCIVFHGLWNIRFHGTFLLCSCYVLVMYLLWLFWLNHTNITNIHSVNLTYSFFSWILLFTRFFYKHTGHHHGHQYVYGIVFLFKYFVHQANWDTLSIRTVTTKCIKLKNQYKWLKYQEWLCH